MIKCIGVDINKPVTAEMEEVAREQLTIRWGQMAGGQHVEIVSETETVKTIDWKSVDAEEN